MNISWPVKSDEFLKLLGIKLPVIKAPMAGGPSSPDLVATVSKSGGLGSIGGGYLAPDILEKQICEVKSQTNKPFGVNLFITDPDKEITKPGKNISDMLKNYAAELGVEITGEIAPFPDFEKQFEVVIDNKVKVFSFTFGIPENKYIVELKRNNVLVIGTATSVGEALELQNAGCDAVVAQGYEAGGHRGSFDVKDGLPLIGIMALVPQIADRLSIPVIASGGIMDGRGIYAALSLGASAVQMGTAFLTCDEANVNQSWVDLLLNSQDVSTVLTNAYTGKYARGIKTRFTLEMQQYEKEVPEYPSQHQHTRELRAEAKKLNNSEFMSFWAGQGSSMTRKTSAKGLIEELVKEYIEVSGKMGP